jgi:hypothetical protein
VSSQSPPKALPTHECFLKLILLLLGCVLCICGLRYDGFEKMALIAGQDFDHSKQTWTSGLYRGHPTPDWYHFEGWPLRWGLGVLQAMTLAHDAMRIDTAVEASFMAPGLGPWRPDMVSTRCPSHLLLHLMSLSTLPHAMLS